MPEIAKTLSGSSISKAAKDFSNGKVTGVGINADPMYYVIEYASSSGENRLLKYIPGETPRVEHFCEALKNPSTTCRHLAYGYMVEKYLGGNPPNQVVSVSQEPSGLTYTKDISPETIRRQGNFQKAEAAGAKSEPKEPGKPEKPEKPERLYLDFTDSDVFDVYEYLKREGVSGNVISKVLANRRKDCPPKPERLYHGRQAIQFGLVAALLKRNIVFWGHKSTGKDTLVNTLCWCLGAVPLMISGYSEIAGKDDLLYSREAEGKGDGSFKTYRELGVLPRAMMEGKILVINEAAAIKPEVLISINPATDGRRSIYIPGHGTIKARDGFMVIYLTNTGYEGLFGTNESTFDRTVAWETTYDPEALKEILDDMLPEDKVLSKLLCKLFGDLMEAVGSRRLDSSRGISFRGIIDAVELYKMSDGAISIMDALRAGISNKILEPKELSEDRKTIDDLIDGVFKEKDGD